MTGQNACVIWLAFLGDALELNSGSLLLFNQLSCVVYRGSGQSIGGIFIRIIDRIVSLVHLQVPAFEEVAAKPSIGPAIGQEFRPAIGREFASLANLANVSDVGFSSDPLQPASS